MIRDKGTDEWKERRDLTKGTSMSFVGGGGGTPRYRDPAATSGRSDHRKDSNVYSFAALAWEVLSGVQPFAGVDVAAMSVNVAAGERPPMEALPQDTPAAIPKLIERCWAAEQAKRPTAEEFWETLLLTISL